MKTVVERLRAENQQERAQDYAKGVGIGKYWATDFAKPKELKRLEKHANSVGDLEVYFNNGEPLAPWGWSDWMVFEILGTHEDDRTQVVSGSFWEKLGIDTDEPQQRDLVESGDFLAGFVTGALEVWEAVADQI